MMMRVFGCIICAILFANECRTEMSAVCEVKSGSGSGTVFGTIKLTQPSEKSNISLEVNLSGFDMSNVQRRGFHVHEKPSVGSFCNDAGAHYNLDHTLHGAPDDPKDKRHTGDLGNIPIDSAGTDDLGRGNAPLSNTTGNAGGRLGCCLIQQTSGATHLLKHSTSTTHFILLSTALLFFSFVSKQI